MKTLQENRTKRPLAKSAKAEPAAEELMTKYLPLVRSVAEKIHRRLPPGVDLESLVHSGVVGLLEAYWDAYEAVELNTYADINYLEEVWDYHARMVEAIIAGDAVYGKQLLIEHMALLSQRGISIESRAHVSEVAAPRPVAAL